MVVLSVNDISIEFQGEKLFDHLSFLINEKDRVAIIGPNGTGKTTLLKIILDKLTPSSGTVVLAKNLSVGYLSQEVISSQENTLLEEAMLVFEDVIRLEKELKKIELDISLDPTNHVLLENYGKKQNAFMLKDGYNYHYLVEMMLGKFGFKKDDFNRKINSFSGGEKTKMSFVKLLLMKPKLLILDEPTNHLDVITIEWLETYLKSYDGTLLFVSHDRYFINSLCNKVLELDDGHIDTYKGNYDYYVQEKKLRYEQALKAYNIQQKEIAKIKRFIEFYMPKPRFVSRAKDRVNKLNHIKVIDKPKGEDRAIKIDFKGESLKGKQCIAFHSLTLGYEFPLVKNIDFTLYGQDKLAIMGNNGTGKTTLLKVLRNELEPLEGEVQYLRNLKIGYIDQHHFDISGPETILEEMMNEFVEMGEKEIFNYMGRFNFSYEDCSKVLDVLSGGEKMRLLLAKVIKKEYDLLLLDEPTNHLDMVTKQALTIALREFKGSIIFVSHDRYFIDEIANKVLYFYDGKAILNKGNYQDFKEIEQELFLDKENIANVKVTKDTRVKKETMPLSKLEAKIAQLEKRIHEIKEAQFIEENYMDANKMKSLDEELKRNQDEYSRLEEEYISRLES